MSAFIGGRGPYGNGANRLEPTKTGPAARAARRKTEADHADRSFQEAEDQVEIERRLDGSHWLRCRGRYLRLRHCAAPLRPSVSPSALRPPGLAEGRANPDPRVVFGRRVHEPREERDLLALINHPLARMVFRLNQHLRTNDS
jgi:hypothetical protein